MVDPLAVSPIQQTYEQRKQHYAQERARAESLSARISFARFAVFLGTIVVLGVIVWRHLPSASWALFFVGIAAFVALVLIHAGVLQRVTDARRGERLYEHGLLRVLGKFREIPCDLPGAPAGHPYADDLDVLGKGSLLHRLDRTQTRAGRAVLEQLLLQAASPFDAGAGEALRARQAAVRELAGLATWRERIATELAADLDPAPLLTAMRSKVALPAAPLFRLLGVILPLLTFACFLWRPQAWALPVAGSFVLSMVVAAKLGPLFQAARHLPDLVRPASLLVALGAHSFECEKLAELRQKLAAAGAVLARLRRTASFVSARENEVFRLLIGPIMAWDVHCGLHLLTIKNEGTEALAAGFEALAELEALASLGWFAAEEPGISFPEIASPGGTAFEASQLAHPLLASHVRKANDVAVGACGQLLLVTGSNMSGKSTLLRAMGLSLVLARAGAPVCATRLVIGPAHLAVSLRMRDDVGEGVSRFYAELRKLKVILDAARASTPASAAFFLVDEILSGTNSRERAIGARALLLALIEAGAFGVASTHDLELHALAEDPRVTICHFEEQVQDGKLTFDHLLRPGPVVSSNALRLMHEVGLDVVDP